LNKTPNNKKIKGAPPLIVDSSIDKIPKAVLDNPIGDGFVNPKTLINCWNEEKDK